MTTEEKTVAIKNLALELGIPQSALNFGKLDGQDWWTECPSSIAGAESFNQQAFRIWKS